MVHKKGKKRTALPSAKATVNPKVGRKSSASPLLDAKNSRLSITAPKPDVSKAVAIILMGDSATSDVAGAARVMKVAKEMRDCVDVRIINMLNCKEEDISFLYRKDLAEVAVMGHSGAVGQDGRTYIEMEKREIGHLKVTTAAELIKILAQYTKASRYTFYPCEVADRRVNEERELRDYENLEGSLTHDRSLECVEDIERLNVSGGISTLDIMREHIERGAQANPRRESERTQVEGQVGPGDPSQAVDFASPRASINREEARTVIAASKPVASRRDKKRAEKIFDKKKKVTAKTNWEVQTITLSKDNFLSSKRAKVDKAMFSRDYNGWRTEMMREKVQEEKVSENAQPVGRETSQKKHH